MSQASHNTSDRNQVVVRFHVPRTSHCHHCHRMFDQRLSVSEGRYGMFFFNGGTVLLCCFLFLQIGMMAEMARSPVNLDNLMNEGIAFATDRF